MVSQKSKISLPQNPRAECTAVPQTQTTARRSESASWLPGHKLLQRILRIVEGKDGQGIHIPSGRKGIYDNQSLMKLLNVSGAYLRKLRDNGYLGFSRHGDKYWYTQEDVDRFIRRFHYEAFAIADVLPEQKESIHG